MYEYDSRVRLSEADQNRRMTLLAVLNHFQDCSTFHSEDIGVGMKYLEQQNRMWVLRSWKIVVHRYPELGEKIRVGTWPYSFDTMTGKRNFRMLDETGELVAYADTLWVYMDTKRMRPARVDEEIRKAYRLEPGLMVEHEENKLRIPEQTEPQDPFQIHPYHLDVNHHVNNGQYVLMAMNYLPENFEICQMRAEYRKSAVLNDMVHPVVGRTEDGYTVVLSDDAGRIYAVIEFRQEKKKCR